MAEEARRRDNHKGEISRLLQQAFLTGSVFFRGSDRSPDENDRTVVKAAEAVMSDALPEVFDRFHMGAARVARSDLVALVENADLRGLPAVFTTLKLLRIEGAHLCWSPTPARCSRCSPGSPTRTTTASRPQGKALDAEYGKSPYGWDFDVVKLFALCLLRAGWSWSRARARRSTR